MLHLDQQILAMFYAGPLREFHFRLPVRMDDGSLRVFQVFAVQHNDARGRTKGGIRFHPMRTIDTVRRPGDVDDLEWAVADIRWAAVKGGVIVDPAT